MAIPVYIISGFLGSGKTTLLNHILRQVPRDLKVALVVNEFGSVSIDGKIIEREGYSLTEITNGCICCTLRRELTRGLVDIVHDIKPDLVIIETTGLSFPDEIARDMKAEELRGRVECQGIIVLLNAPSYLAMQEKYMVVNAQMEGATKIVLNKIDLVDGDLLDKTREKAREMKPANALLFETKFGEIEIGELFPELRQGAVAQAKVHLGPEGPSEGHSEEHDHEHGGTDDFASFTVKSAKPLCYADVAGYFETSGKWLVRAKGVVETEVGNKLFQFSSNGLDVSDYRQDHAGAELVFITLKVDEEVARAEADRIFMTRVQRS